MRNLINDPHFHIDICPFASSPSPEKAIWDSQHHCVSEDAQNSKIPETAESAGNGIIKHQLKHEHWGVLNQAFVKLRCYGFPHSAIAQITRHQDSHFLVQSMRYTGERLLKADLENLEDIFYLRPAGMYRDRAGNTYDYTGLEREDDKGLIYAALLRYQDAVNDGMPMEMARGKLPYDFRQDFVIAGTVEAVFHWLDQRTKENAQLEVYTLAWMALEVLKRWSPTFFQWYEENRAGKARLAP